MGEEGVDTLIGTDKSDDLEDGDGLDTVEGVVENYAPLLSNGSSTLADHYVDVIASQGTITHTGTLFGSDADYGDSLTFELIDPIFGMRITNSYYNRFDFAYDISVADAGATYPFKVRIKDDSEWELFSEDTFYLTIRNPDVTSNHTPVAHPDFYEVGLGSTLTIGDKGVLTNDGDHAPGSLQICTHDAPSGVTVNSNGSFSWTPTVAGIFYWTYRAIDVASGISNLAQVQVQVDDARGKGDILLYFKK